MLNDILLEIKEAEKRAEEHISQSSDDAAKIVDNAHKEAQRIINASKNESNKKSIELLKKAKNEGESEAEKINKEGKIKADNIKKSAHKNIDPAVKIIINSVLRE